ncbi:hypothetical protein EH223_06650 [candidate division KSB1 bacterium]|nr:hypothetical protein [candidate division KSB1 bacterium]RQW04831.1 MAG: hypothetical protein EH223_06650 [candidate division KSB1 bacterium]
MLSKIDVRVVLAGFLLLVMGCSKDAPLIPQIDNQSAVVTSIKLNQKGYAAVSLDSLILEVIGEGVTRIRKELIIDGTKAQTQIQVPVDEKLRMEVTGYQDSTAVLFGSQEFMAQKGETVPVEINLDFMVSTIILSPPDSSLKTGEQIAIHLAARKVLEMSTFGVLVHFDPTRLQVVELQREDDFLTSNSGSVMPMEFTKDNVAGTVKIILGIFPASAGVSGTGDIGKIVFEAIASDTTDISIQVDNRQNSDLGLFDKSANLIYSVGLGSRLFIQQNSEL